MTTFSKTSIFLVLYGDVFIKKRYGNLLKYKESVMCLNDLLYNNKIKLIAIDIDGTLADDDGKISDINLSAISLANKLGIKVILATGRLHPYAMKMFTQKQIQNFNLEKIDGIFSHGAYAYLKGYKTVLRKFSFFDLELILYALSSHNVLENAVFLTVDSAYVLSTNDEIQHEDAYIDTDDELKIKSSIKYAKINNKDYTPIVLNNVRDIFTIGDIISIEIYNQLYANQDISNDALNTLHAELDNYYKIYVPGSNNKLVLSPLNTSKIYGLNYISKLYNIHVNEILSIGNDTNDIELLASTGYSVAVKNSTYGALKVARCICTHTNNQNAIANIVYKTIKGKQI
ncbi:haloacid dehalogenase-like hydrolase, putative [Plasmodium vinckei lentum]|uniref:Haloacid dehalogenase-like hydrolase, putative n=1 Tax=Plasmodium vinckei lentum TaxID=138297 RepID=A0A6V7T109_PLAVN|nr:haloacid dehalogenase-like hydrolase, putative [Plasmodium vinckei lentum]